MSAGDETIRFYTVRDHIRTRTGMYINNTRGGKSIGDGVYLLLMEVMENATDEFRAGFGDRLEIRCGETHFSVRDFGRGIPPESLRAVCEKPYGDRGIGTDGIAAAAYGPGLNVVLNLCREFRIRTVRGGRSRELRYLDGELADDRAGNTDEPSGTLVEAYPDPEIFPGLKLRQNCLRDLVSLHLAANPGLEIGFGFNAGG